MGIEQDYDIRNIARVHGHMNLGRVLAPFFTDENWEKLMEAHNFFQSGIIVRAAESYNEWFEKVYQAIQEECAERDAAIKKEHEEWEAMKERIEEFAPAMREFIDNFNKSFE